MIHRKVAIRINPKNSHYKDDFSLFFLFFKLYLYVKVDATSNYWLNHFTINGNQTLH